MTNNANAWLFEKGKIVSATKLPVITIGLGEVSKLKELNGIIWKDDNDGNVRIRTKEDPSGAKYDPSWQAVVRLFGDKIVIDGEYDLYAVPPEKATKLLGNTFDIDSLDNWTLSQLVPLLNAASEIRASMSPEEIGRKVILVTEEMLEGCDCKYCNCSWNTDGALTPMGLCDVFVVEDEDKMQGYRIGMEEFFYTHTFQT